MIRIKYEDIITVSLYKDFCDCGKINTYKLGYKQINSSI